MNVPSKRGEGQEDTLSIITKLTVVVGETIKTQFENNIFQMIAYFLVRLWAMCDWGGVEAM